MVCFFVLCEIDETWRAWCICFQLPSGGEAVCACVCVYIFCVKSCLFVCACVCVLVCVWVSVFGVCVCAHSVCCFDSVTRGGMCCVHFMVNMLLPAGRHLFFNNLISLVFLLIPHRGACMVFITNFPCYSWRFVS